MKIRLKKLYSDSGRFEPIKFVDGVNLILGEKVPEEEVKTKKDRKTNGVGKSMSIEFINFCLLSDSDNSRVLRIPLDKFPDAEKIRLDLEINGRPITIMRSKAESEKPTIAYAGKEKQFSNIVDAQEFLDTMLYENEESEGPRPSFRQLLGPIIREESSEFKDILHCYDLLLRIPPTDLIKPHLYMFGIDFQLIDKIKDYYTKIDGVKKAVSLYKESLTRDGGTISDARKKVNALEGELRSIEQALDNFKTDPAFQINQSKIVRYESELDKLRTDQTALRLEQNRIESMPKLEEIPQEDIKVTYAQFHKGLSELVSRSIDEVIEFKKKIEKYQSMLLGERMESIRSELKRIGDRIIQLEDSRSDLLKTVRHQGLLKDFRNGIETYTRQKDELGFVTSHLQEYDAAQVRSRQLAAEKDNLFSILHRDIYEKNEQIQSFTHTVADMHESIMGNRGVSFEIRPIDNSENSKTRRIISMELRIDDDGSHSVERSKVFMYDMALMLNDYTRRNHPGFLVHDNIFDVDQDTLVESLNFLATQEAKKADFQYILTLNRDKVEAEERKDSFKLDIDAHKRANFTRQNKFLKLDYQEILLKD